MCPPAKLDSSKIVAANLEAAQLDFMLGTDQFVARRRVWMPYNSDQ